MRRHKYYSRPYLYTLDLYWYNITFLCLHTFDLFLFIWFIFVCTYTLYLYVCIHLNVLIHLTTWIWTLFNFKLIWTAPHFLRYFCTYNYIWDIIFTHLYPKDPILYEAWTRNMLLDLAPSVFEMDQSPSSWYNTCILICCSIMILSLDV